VVSARTGGNGLTAASTGKWKKEEQLLRQLAEAVVAELARPAVGQDINKIAWCRIADKCPGRIAGQCKQRWKFAIAIKPVWRQEGQVE
jgi:hypothetical protein